MGVGGGNAGASTQPGTRNATSGPPPAPVPTTRALAPAPNNVAISYRSDPERRQAVNRALQNAGVPSVAYDPVQTAAAAQARGDAAQQARMRLGRQGYLSKSELPDASNPANQAFWEQADKRAWAKANPKLAENLIKKTGFRPDNWDEIMGNPPSEFTQQLKAREANPGFQDAVKGYARDMEDPLEMGRQADWNDASSPVKTLEAVSGAAGLSKKLGAYQPGSGEMLNEWSNHGAGYLQKLPQLGDALGESVEPYARRYRSKPMEVTQEDWGNTAPGNYVGGPDYSKQFDAQQFGTGNDYLDPPDLARKLKDSALRQVKNSGLAEGRAPQTTAADYDVTESGQPFLNLDQLGRLRHGFQVPNVNARF